MTYNEVVKIGDTHLLPIVWELYGLEGYEAKLIERDFEARNAVYCCEKEGENTKILRISYLNDRSREELLAEGEYIRYLFKHGGNVSNVINSRNGNLFEEITYNDVIYFVSLFEKAKGVMLAENGYQYREGVPVTEYFYNCGQTLGKLHQLSKEYTPTHRRYSFFDKYNSEYINELIPHSFDLLKRKLKELLKTLEGLGYGQESFGMIHFDYNDSNYSIDLETGQITVYDFDDSCFGWYMYDLAFNWMYAVGWIQWEKDAAKRKEYMDNFFKTVLEGYKSETGLEDWLLEKFPFFINVVMMALIIDAFENIRNNGEESEYDFELSYLIKCIEDDIPYMGFFHEMYSCEKPFEYEDERISLFVTDLSRF